MAAGREQRQARAPSTSGGGERDAAAQASAGSSQRVAHAAHGLDLLARARASRACAADGRCRRRACCRGRSRRPASRGRRQRRGGARPRPAGGERGEQPELGRRQRARCGRPTRTACAAGSSRKPPSRPTSGGAAARRSSACTRTTQLGERERLGEVVVAAGVKAGQPVGQRVAGGEEQHRGAHAVRAQRLADVAAVGVRQPDVEHQHVGRRRRERLAPPRARSASRARRSPRRPSARASTERRSASSSQSPTRTEVTPPNDGYRPERALTRPSARSTVGRRWSFWSSWSCFWRCRP